MKSVEKIIRNSEDAITELEVENSLRKVLKDPDVLAFIQDKKLNRQIITDNSLTLLSYSIKKKNCINCKGLEVCQQTVRGKAPILEYNEDEAIVELDYQSCKWQNNLDKVQEESDNLKLYGMNPEEFERGKVYVNERRAQLLSKFKNFLMEYPKKQIKGIYLFGPYGCGKSYLMADLAKKLAKKGHEVLYIYYPNLTRQIKSAIGSSNFEEMIEELKNVDILILDDFGGEMPSSFIRDEVLTPILQERMVFHRPVFMTSNLGLEQLQNHLAEDSKFVDQNRAYRVIERMRTLMEFIEINDKNYRV